MAVKLAVTTLVQAPAGSAQQVVVLGPDDDVPDWALDQLGDHCFEGGKKPSSKQASKKSEAVEAPPRAGKGSGQSEWVAFARDNRVDVADDESRESIIGKCEAVGLVDPAE